MEDTLLGLTYKQSRLTNTESMEFFIILLSELQRTKESLIHTLPFIASQAYSTDVKMLLLESATIINGQLMRIMLSKTLLGITLFSKSPILNWCLNLNQYLKDSMEDKSSKIDAIILTNLMIAEGSEIDAFKTLVTLAKFIKPRSAGRLMTLCCKEAVNSKKAINSMLARYN